MFKKILIANRGEIACRVIKTARKMGIATVAVYSEADRDARHVELADEAVLHRSGAQPRVLSRGRQDHRRLQADRRAGGAPGLRLPVRERSLRKRCRGRGHRLHRPEALFHRAMGDKIASKKLAKEAKVNTIPGHNDAIDTPEQAVEIARDIGYPVMIKASAGGGGKGLRVAFNDKEASRASPPAATRRATASATTASSSRNSSRSRATSKSRCWATPRQRGLPERARVLDPAPPPEGDRGGAVALHQRRHAQGDGRAGGGAGQGGEVPERRHGGVRGRPRPGASTSSR
jgi:hypothetical protein